MHALVVVEATAHAVPGLTHQVTDPGLGHGPSCVVAATTTIHIICTCKLLIFITIVTPSWGSVYNYNNCNYVYESYECGPTECNVYCKIINFREGLIFAIFTFKFIDLHKIKTSRNLNLTCCPITEGNNARILIPVNYKISTCYIHFKIGKTRNMRHAKIIDLQ